MSDETAVTAKIFLHSKPPLHDAFGDGFLLWGGSSAANCIGIFHPIEHGLIVQDLGGQPVFGAEVEALDSIQLLLLMVQSYFYSRNRIHNNCD